MLPQKWVNAIYIFSIRITGYKDNLIYYSIMYCMWKKALCLVSLECENWTRVCNVVQLNNFSRMSISDHSGKCQFTIKPICGSFDSSCYAFVGSTVKRWWTKCFSAHWRKQWTTVVLCCRCSFILSTFLLSFGLSKTIVESCKIGTIHSCLCI